MSDPKRSRDTPPDARADCGYAMLAVVAAMTLGTLLALAALTQGMNQQRSSAAMVLSNHAFFVAEAGLNEVMETLPTSQLRTVEVADSLVLDWDTVGTRQEYRAVFHRVDDGEGSGMIFELQVHGRASAADSASRMVSSWVIYNDATWKFDAAMKIRGRLRMDSGTEISGRDVNPDVWPTERCDDIELEDASGVIMLDTLQKSGSAEHNLDGVPPLQQDSMIDDATFASSGEIDWSELAGLADHTRGCIGCGKQRYNPRATTFTDADGNEVCDRSDPNNFGSPDPTHPCYDYFPIMRVHGGGILLEGGDRYAQGIFIVDGAELDIENPLTFAGIVLSRGCHEIDDEIYGAIVHDQYPGAHCAASERGVYLDDNTADVHYSQCAVRRALEHSALGMYMGTSFDPLPERGFIQTLR
jgi:hypothetical protein